MSGEGFRKVLGAEPFGRSGSVTGAATKFQCGIQSL